MHYICQKVLARLIMLQQHTIQIEPAPDHRLESVDRCSLDGDIEFGFMNQFEFSLDPVGSTPDVKAGDVFYLIQLFRPTQRKPYQPKFSRVTIS